jgi:nitroreductase
MSIALNELISSRWSPYEYLSRPVETEKLAAVFEAARWAASCFNEQAWRFVYVTQAEPEAFQKMLGVLAERNQRWAKSAYVLGFSAGKKTFTHNGAPNRFALHDTGAASANLALEAVAVGLRAHFMGGLDAQKARTEFHVPDDFEVGAALALGYIDEVATRRPGTSTRKTLNEIVFRGDWGGPAGL